MSDEQKFLTGAQIRANLEKKAEREAAAADAPKKSAPAAEKKG